MRSVWTHCFELICWDSQSFFSMDWFTGKFTGKPPYFMGKSMVSSRFSQQNQSIDFCFGSDLGTLGVIFTSRRRCCWGPSLTSRLTAKFWTVWRRTKHEQKPALNATAAHERCWSAGHQYPWLQLATDDQTSETIGDSSFLLGTFVRVDFFQMNKWHLGVSFTEDVGQHHLAPPAAECDILVTNVLVTSFSHGQVLESSQHRCDLHVGGMVPCQKLVQYTANWSNQCKRLIHSEFFCCANPFRKDFKTYRWFLGCWFKYNLVMITVCCSLFPMLISSILDTNSELHVPGIWYFWCCQCSSCMLVWPRGSGFLSI